MKRLLVLACALTLVSGQAHAQTGFQKSSAALNAEISQFFPDQNQGLINPFNTRQMLLDMVASFGVAPALRWGTLTPGLPTIATGELYYDQTNGFAEHNAALNIVSDLGPSAPSGVIPSAFTLTECQGNNTTFVGCTGAFIQVQDRASVTTGNKGVLYGVAIDVAPSFTRNNTPFDDAAGVVVDNVGVGKGTDAICVCVAGGPGGSQWVTGVEIAANVDSAYRFSATANYGLDFVSGTIAIFNNQAIRVPNGAWSGGRNAGNSADVNVWSVQGASPSFNGTATNDNAVTGAIGELISSTVTSPGSSITSGTASNITSISLTAGDWDVDGQCVTVPAATTTVSQLFCSVGTASATANLTPGFFSWFSGFGVAANQTLSQQVVPTRFSLAATTTVYLVVNNGFATSTETAYGIIRGRRVR